MRAIRIPERNKKERKLSRSTDKRLAALCQEA
jgi:hypothetical protein